MPEGGEDVGFSVEVGFPLGGALGGALGGVEVVTIGTVEEEVQRTVVELPFSPPEPFVLPPPPPLTASAKNE